VALNGILHALLTLHSPFQCQLVLIDPKKVELIQYEELPHTARYASEPVDMIRALRWAVDETDRRFACMQQARAKEYTGPHLYVIIDELADLMTTMKKEALPLLQRLAQVGRAARVHVIACTQNVLAVTIPTVLKCNFSTILGLRTCNAQQSRFLIAAGGCEMLPDPKREGKGYGFIRDGADLEKILVYKYPEPAIDFAISWWTSSACIAG
jgi:S-DNA-T family DNA segregation ATPase FtsK/SpoIIIE